MNLSKHIRIYMMNDKFYNWKDLFGTVKLMVTTDDNLPVKHY